MDGRTDGREKKNTSKINWHSGLDYKLPSRLIPKLTVAEAVRFHYRDGTALRVQLVEHALALPRAPALRPLSSSSPLQLPSLLTPFLPPPPSPSPFPSSWHTSPAALTLGWNRGMTGTRPLVLVKGLTQACPTRGAHAVRGEGSAATAAKRGCLLPLGQPGEVEQCPPKIHVHPEPQNVTSFGNRVFADAVG